MKTKSNSKSVSVITLGCSKNLVDSEVLLGQLKAGGVAAFHNPEKVISDTVIINTCGFINDAKEESIDTILAWAEAKKRGDIKKLVVMGCLSQRYREELKNEIPEADNFFGVDDMPQLLSSIGVDYKKELLGERMIATPAHYAYLKISEGCDRTCAFCAIPLIRGKHRSRPVELLVEEAEFLAARGVKELIVIAQDTTYYGLDLYKKRHLNDLLIALSEVKGIQWIRLHYTYPAGFPDEILHTIASKPSICNYVDIPIQHISDPVLKAMRRGHNEAQTRNLITRIRAAMPDAAIRTTIITGFPGETQADFDQLKAFITETRFDRLGVFTYSHEENTGAYRLTDDVEEEVKAQRAAELMEIQQDISLEKNLQKIGCVVRVIVDRKESGHWIARSEHDSPEVDNEILIPVKYRLHTGCFYDVEITGAEPFDLYARPADE